MTIKTMGINITKESAEADYELLVSLLGSDKVDKLFLGIVIDFNHAGVRNITTNHALLYRIAERHGLQKNLLSEFEAIIASPVSGKFAELSERYLALMIAEQEFSSIKEALPERKVLDGSNPDWTLRDEDSEFYLEVSAISIQKVINDLQAFGGRIPTSQIIHASKQPVYFEIIFKDNPRGCDPADISRQLIGAIKNNQLPIDFEDKKIRGTIDYLERRHQLPQIISGELNDMAYLKSTCLRGGELGYTLAAKISLKSIDSKIDEKKKKNKLNKIGNTWLCIFVDQQRLDEVRTNIQYIARLKKRILNSKWLEGVFVTTLYNDTDGEWQLRYLRLD